jgi:transcriptional regulator of arginine metabolism
MTKNYRQGQILKLIRTKRITTQDELARELRAEGIEATQVTLSRDIRELGLAKTADGYREILPDPIGRGTGTPCSPSFCSTCGWRRTWWC